MKNDQIAHLWVWHVYVIDHESCTCMLARLVFPVVKSGALCYDMQWIDSNSMQVLLVPPQSQQ